jgi:type II secretory ATPase GspE/PulE/Tfp pilus assembly ATPase PilB-like protein
MAIDNIQDILVSRNYVSAENMAKAVDFSEKHHTDPIDFLIYQNLLNKNTLAQAIGEYYGMLYVDLNDHKPTKEMLAKVPIEIATKYRIIMFSEDSGGKYATDQPSIKELIPEIENALGRNKISLYYADEQEINTVLSLYKKPLETRFSQIIEASKRIAPEILEEIISDALLYRASDIHFEPQEEIVVVRFRVDGVLQEAGRFKKENYENILNRIKIMSQLRIDEHFSVQDGAIRFSINDSVTDLRVSITPTLGGETVVLRMLAQYVKELTLSAIGLSNELEKTILESAKKTFGMTIVVGPTGSGKTTTLYSVIKQINDTAINITTIEDPVEYRIIGVNQIQVNPAKKITFADGLKSIVRQDPDVILVGEIRDNETAEISVNAALTGHLLFSTFHANDTATSIPRLLDMGIEPFLLASTLDLLVSQRLIRRLCTNCRYSIDITRIQIEDKIKGAGKYFPEKCTVYESKGCSVCNETGYKGRIGLFEYLKMTRELKDLILTRPSADGIRDLAKNQGFKTMTSDGVDKVRQGLISLEELFRVVPGT